MSQFIEMFVNASTQLKTLAKLGHIGTGNTPSKKKHNYWNGDFPWVAAQDMEGMYIFDTLEKLTVKGKEVASILPVNSLLYVCRGSIGKMSINKIECGYNQSICSFHCNDIAPEYIYHALLQKEDEIKAQGTGTSFGSINQREFSNIEIPEPTKDKQDKFLSIVHQADKSKSCFLRAQVGINIIIGKLINQVA